MPTVQTFGPAKPYDVTPPIGPVDVLQAQGLQQRNALAGLQVQAAQQQQQEHNALRQVLSAPGAIGDDGLPTKNALSNVLQVSPTAYNSLVTQISNVQQKKALALQEQARAENQQADTLKKYGEAIKAGKERALGVALDMAKATGSDDAGNRAGNVEWAKQMDEWTASNAVPKEVLKNAPKDFSIPAFQSMLLDYKTRMEMQSREEGRAPAIHTFPVGTDEQATVQWNPKTGQYDLIAGSKRKDPTMAGAASPYKNMQPDGKGGFVGFNPKTGQVEQVPMAEGAQSKGSKEGLTVADKMNPTMLATVRLDITEGRRALGFMKDGALDEGSPFYANPHPSGAIARLAQKIVTPEKQQEFDVYANKLGQAIASAQSMGRGQISDRKIEEAQKMIPVMGDSQKVRALKMEQLGLFFKYVDDVLKTPIKADARGPADDQQDVNDFSHLWK